METSQAWPAPHLPEALAAIRPSSLSDNARLGHAVADSPGQVGIDRTFAGAAS